MTRTRDLGFNFIPGQGPQPGKGGRIPTTMEWSRKLTADDIGILKGATPYSEKVPDVDEGFTPADIADATKRQVIEKIGRGRGQAGDRAMYPILGWTPPPAWVPQRPSRLGSIVRAGRDIRHR